MTAPSFDLQSHSTWSDGALSPREVVEVAAAAGVDLFALTDHDAVDGIDEALAAAAETGIRLVTGVEVSTIDDVAEDLHILGYGIDHHDPALLEALTRYRADREARAERMAEALGELGWQLDDRELRERRSAGLSIGRPHLAAAAFQHPGNAERLAHEQLATPTDLLVAYLTPGRPAYRSRTLPTVGAAIEVIHAAGGYAVWAHPFWDVDAFDAVASTLRRFAALGLDGVEAFYVEHDRRQTTFLTERALELGLLTTGSADFHGPEHAHFAQVRAFDLYGVAPNLGPIDPAPQP